MRRKKTIQERKDSYLIKQVKQNADSEAFQEVCRRYEDLFYKVCQKYAASLSACGIFLQDIFNEKNVIILHCVKTFKPSKKTKLSSWIGNYARYLCLNSMNAKRLIVPTLDGDIQKRIEQNQIVSDYVHQPLDADEVKNNVFNLLGELKDLRIKEIFELRYMQPKKMIWQKIAKKMKTSPQTVMALHRKGLSLIKNKISSEDDIPEKSD